MNYNHYIEQFDDFLNAILVKELRQTVRGKFFWSIFLLFLLFICLVLFFSLNEVNRYGGFHNGETTASFLLAILYFISGLLVPINLGKKTAAEIGDATNELLYITTMTPSSIIKGKFLCGAVIILMLYSAIVPFLSLTLFMGGVDVRLLLLVVFFSYIFSNLGVIFQIFVAMSNTSDVNDSGSAGVVNTVVASVIHLVLWITSVSFGASFMNRYSMRDSSEIVTLVVIFVIVCVVFGLLFAASSIKLEPETSNKMYTFRVWASIIWMIGTLATSFVNFEVVVVWSSCVLIALILFSFNNQTEPEVYSNRILSEIPDSLFNKISKFPFFTGVVNGFTWNVFVAILTLMVVIVGDITHKIGYHSDREFILCVFITQFLHANAHGFFASFIRKNILKASNRKGNFNFALASYIITGVVATIVYNMFDGRRNPIGIVCGLINPFFIFTYGTRGEGLLPLIAAVILFGIAVLLNIKSIIEQLTSYFNKGAED